MCRFPRSEPHPRRLIAQTSWHDPVGSGLGRFGGRRWLTNPAYRPGMNSSDLDVYFLVCAIFLVLWFCRILKRFRYFWLSDAVTDRKPTRHRPTRTWEGLPIQMLKKFRVKNIFPSSRKKIEQSKILKLQKSDFFWILENFENFDFLKKYRYFLVLFFMIHGARRANGDSSQVAVDRWPALFLRHLT